MAFEDNRDEFYKRQRNVTQEEQIEQSKSDFEKGMDELRDAAYRAPKSKDIFEELNKQHEQKKRDGWDYDR